MYLDSVVARHALTVSTFYVAPIAKYELRFEGRAQEYTSPKRKVFKWFQ